MTQFKNYNKVKKEYGVGGGGAWLTLQEGDNKIRIVSEFQAYGNHFDPSTNKSAICIGKEECQYCKQGLKPNVQFLGYVIDRNDNKVKLLRIGYQIFQQLGEFGESEDYAFDVFPDYDITIKRTGEKLATKYTVIPARKNSKLTKEEKEMIEEKSETPKEIIESMKAKEGKETTDKEIPTVEENEDAPDENYGA